MRWAENADNHALKQHRLSQNIFPVGSWCGLGIASDLHLEPESEKRAKNVDLLTANKNSEVSILRSAHKQGHPSFHCHAPGSKRRYPCTQTAKAVPKYFPCLLQFCTGYRNLTCISSLKAKNERKTLIYSQLKISRYNRYFFAIFRRILRN